MQYLSNNTILYDSKWRQTILQYNSLKDDFQAFGATDGSTVDNRLTFGVDRAVWTLAAKMDDGAPWHKGVLQGAEKFMASWHKEEEEASRRRATKRDSRDLEPPTHL